MTQEELYKSLYDITIDEILKHHCNINESAKQKLYEIVKYGVDRMSVHDRYNGEQIALAQKNAKQMAAFICNKVQSYGQGGRIQGRIINESLVIEARFSICPLWPFC